MLAGVALHVAAQKGLRINEVFEGKVVDRGCMQESLIKGEDLAPYKLRVLHTVRFAATYAERDDTEGLFMEDMKGRLSDETDNMEMERHGEHLYYAIVQIADTPKGLHRYICYQCKEKGSRIDITLAYMEGRATLADLRATFKKK